MKLFYSILLFTLIYISVNGQAISGQINIYTAVDSINICQKKIAVNSALGFAVGDRVLIIQMTGATINTTNSVLFGSVTSINNCGNYEFGTISNVIGNLIYLTSYLTKSYDITAKIQLIKVPTYNSCFVSGAPLTGQPWNGTTGGVIALKVIGTLSLFDNIVADGIGFRGGTVNSVLLPWNGSNCNYANYYTSATTGLGAMKGEGISAYIANQEYGRGNQANGGGGGNSVNSGGAGGANYSLGGSGGNEFDGCGSPLSGGQAGQGLLLNYNNANNKIFMGGGGGGGHQDLGAVGTNGTNGGGIIIIDAGSLNGNGFIISANGESQLLQAGLDGAGGAGAGGTVLLNVATYTSSVNVNVVGGDGSSINGIGNNGCWGPGGGGGGGVVWHSGAILSPFVTVSNMGGQPGIFINPSSPCNNTSNGAQAGQNGGILSNLNLPAPSLTNGLYAGNDTTVCGGQPCTLVATGSASTYSWSPASAFINANLNAAIIANPTSTSTYSVTGTNLYGCVVSDTLTVNIIAGATAIVSSNDTICNGGFSSLSAGGGTVYNWFPSIGLSATNLSSVVASPSTTTTYYVEVSNTTGCVSKDTGQIIVFVNSFSQVDAGPDIYLPSDGSTTINASAIGTSANAVYSWQPTTGIDNAGILNPTLVANAEMDYVLFVNDNNCISSDTMHVYIISANLQVPTAFSPNFDGHNDLFGIANPEFTGRFNLKIFNRWGQMLFETPDYAKGWNGTFQKKEMPADTYTYVIVYSIGNEQKERIKKGSITLLR